MRGRVEPVPAISLLGGACMSYTFSLSRRSLPVRCLCLLLIVLVLWCFFMVPRAGAVAVEAATVAYGGLLVGTILVGAGVVFSSHGDMAKAGNAMYKTLQKGNEAIASKIAAISVWAVEHGKAIGSAALRIGKDLYQGIVDTFNAAYSSGKFSYPVDVTSINRSNADAFCDSFNALHLKNASFTDSDGVKHTLICSKESDGYYVKHYVDGVIRNSTGGLSGIADYAIYLHYFNSSHDVEMRLAYLDSDAWSNYGYWTDVFDVPASGSVSSGAAVSVNKDLVVGGSDLAYPSDDYLVKMPDIPSVDTGTGEVTYPDSIAYTKDAVAVPYPVDAEGVKVPDIPYDKVVDQSTGKALDDTGTDTDNPSKPGEGTGTGSNTSLLQKILDLLKNFFDSPSDFRLNMDGFRNLAIKDKFPFCIPFDMVDSVKQFAADAADYQFRVKLDTQYFKVDHVVDLTPLAVPLAFFRYLVVAWFAWVLMSRTHDLMKW